MFYAARFIGEIYFVGIFADRSVSEIVYFVFYASRFVGVDGIFCFVGEII